MAKSEAPSPYEIEEAPAARRGPRPYIPADDDLPPRLVFGFQLSDDSCGWCVADTANRRIVAMGSRVWRAPRDGDLRTGCSRRHDERVRRRALRRRAARKRHALRIMAEFGIVEVGTRGEDLQTRRGERHPLESRAAGLDRRLSDRELAQALYSIAGHRGFIPNGRPDDGDAEAGKVISAVRANKRAIELGGYRTAGEMLAARGRSRNRGGDWSTCVLNEQLVDEARLLISRQAALGNARCAEGLADRFAAEVLAARADVSAQEARNYADVSLCAHFGGDGLKAAPLGAPTAEMVRAWCALADVRIDDGGGCRSLPFDARRRAMSVLFSPAAGGDGEGCRVSYADLREWLGLSDAASFRGVSDEDAEPASPAGWRAMRAHLPAGAMEALASDIGLADAVACAAAYSASAETFAALLSGDEDAPDVEGCSALQRLGEADAAAIAASLPFAAEAFSGYGRRSLRALRMLLARLEHGADGAQAALAASGLAAVSAPGAADLAGRGPRLRPLDEFDPTLKNPVALRAASQLRRLCNAMIDVYGRPVEMRIAMTPRVKLGRDKLKAADARRRAQEARKAVDRAQIAADLGIDSGKVTGRQLLVKELHGRQAGVDLYTGEPIDLARALSERGYAEIAYVLPFSRSYDGTKSNKALSLAGNAAEKGSSSPLEWLEGERADAFRARVAGLRAAGSISSGVADRLLMEGFSDRQSRVRAESLGDDSWMCRLVGEWVSSTLLFADGAPASPVAFPRPAISSALRRFWDIPDDDPDDLRGPAVAAAVLCVSDARAVEDMLSAAAEMGGYDPARKEAAARRAAPWPDFRDQVAAARARIVPSFAQDHKVAGQALAQTTYRSLGVDADGYRVFERNGARARTSVGVEDAGSGGVKLLGDASFLQLWWDPSARGGRGRWLASPVYAADVPALIAGTRVPAYCVKGAPRADWPAVPAAALAEGPVNLFPDDLIEVSGRLRRYNGFSVSTASWSLLGVLQKERAPRARGAATAGLGYAKAAKDAIQPVSTSVLGWPGDPVG